MIKSKSFIRRFIQDENGASAAEYVLILALIGGSIVVAAIALGTAITGELQATADCITGGTAAAC